MATDATTGNQGTITFPTSGFVAKFSMIGEMTQSLDSLNVSSLETEGEEELIPSDLAKNSELEAEFFYTGTPPAPGVVDTPVITYPPNGSQVTGVSYTGSGFFTSRLFPSMKNGEVMKGKAKFQFDNRATPIAITAATD